MPEGAGAIPLVNGDDVPNIPPSEQVEQTPAVVQHIPLPVITPMTIQVNTPATEVPAATPTQRYPTTRSGRVSRPPAHFSEFVQIQGTSINECCCVETEAQTEVQDPVAYATSSDPDVMHLHEAMRQPDRAQFVAAMVKEIQAHTTNGNWIIVLRSSVPPGHDILPAVWAMRRKRRIDTREVYKWKARLNIHGGKQTKGVNYWETYAPVATWCSIRLIMNMSTCMGWIIRQLDFVLAFPQAPVETLLYMEIPKGFVVPGDKSLYVLKLVNNLYGQKQAGRVWYKYLSKGLCKKLGFTQSNYDPCVFWRGKVILVIYTDDTIVTGPNIEEVEKAIKDIANEFVITTEPMVSDFLGVKVTRDVSTKSYSLTQPHLIQSILSDLGLNKESTTRPVPALSSVILQRYDDSPPHSESWHYRSVIGKLNYLEKCTRPDLAYAVHQCARFAHDPKEKHSKAVKLIGRYLLGTADLGIICKPNGDSFKCFADADFAGLWNHETAEKDSSTARSRSGYIILHNNCPIIWASRLQTEIAMSSTESEYVSLSQALREVLPMMRLASELAAAGFPLGTDTPEIHCKAFEDNSGALEMARTPKMRPRTKHMNIKYHHFREAVEDGSVTIHAINTLDQLADICTKPLPQELFERLRKSIMGW
jgi:Reverse transcriptase (RNA-dependent DNA polymerase)